MNLNKTLGRVATTLVAGAMLTALAMPAYAATPAPATDNETVTINSTLTLTDVNKYASVPSASLTYTLTAADGADGVVSAATATSPEILVGVLPAETKKTVTFSNITPWSGEGTDTVTQSVVFDFSGVVFNAPGIYRYVVTEADGDADGNNINSDVTSDTENVRYLDLYVKNGEVGAIGADKYTVYNYVLVKSAAAPDKTGKYGDGNGSKNEGYEATYTTNELDLSKVVTGDLGNKNPGAFDFTVEVGGLAAGDSFAVKSISDKEYQPKEVEAGATSVTINNVKLGDGQHYSIVGLPTGATVKVTENLDANEGYTTTNTVNGVVDADNNKKEANATIVKQETANKIEFTNNRDAVSPTGIVMDIAPYVLLVVVAAAGCFVFLRKRRED
ncbi:QVPTGV class sortase B protein-sorting domain-containing protein [Subdoligranulum variabile]|uniref:QVPTGV class sortase B protein-sorting domain-containing protein n=1 Tax=Subdoligranulum variabile TaxID=214851 RepID=UPI0026F28A89|nr:QVPTGV class sortase B protein-sorting domain-containing protein [Subdoligranulum variabile]